MGSQFIQTGVVAAPVQVILDRVAMFTQKEIILILGADEELKKLQRTLLKVNALEDIVKSKQLHQWSFNLSYRALQLWLRDLQSVLYDAQDLLNNIDMGMSKLNSNDGTASLRDLVFQKLKSLKIPHKMEKIRLKLEGMANEMDGPFLDEVGKLSQPNLVGKLQTSSLVDESCVIGRDTEKNDIKTRLLAEDPQGDNISVISIVGMPGVGKTTLAQLVYNDVDVVNYFEDSQIWVSVSIYDTIERISKTICECACGEMLQLSDLDSIQTRLRGKLHNKKFLIVLDDMWYENVSYWDVLRLPFRDAARGSKILVTTRSTIVSKIVAPTTGHYSVQPWSDHENCWELIKKRALPRFDEDRHQDFKKIGIKIAENCAGLPLAARVIGSVLHFITDAMEWEAISKSKLWMVDNGSEILPALKLSYDHLPLCLQKCFAYCSLFPANFEFKSDDLVQLWVAEGFIPQQETRRIEDVGREYFYALVSMSFFQEHSDQNNHLIYRMHGLVRHLAEFVSDGLCFRMEDHMSQPWHNFENTRHLSLVSNNIQPETWKLFENSDRLRTFFLLSGCQVNNNLDGLFRKLCCVRVLNLSHTDISALPESVEKLIALRYLDVSHTSIVKLPESITKLHWLETIRLNSCLQLRQLPREMKNLTNLRHLHLEKDQMIKINYMPLEFGKLTNLQTLSAFIVGNIPGQGIQELKDMSCIQGSLCITNLENVTNLEDAITAKLNEKPCLDKVELRWDRPVRESDSAANVINRLRPHYRIKELIITGYGGLEFPNWLDISLCRLESIDLLNCYCTTLLLPSSFGKLPMLKSLYIHDMPELLHVQSTLNDYCGCFPSLLTLEFHNMPKLVQWTGSVSTGDMPKLSKLTIESCQKLESLPSLEHLSCLETLNICRCTQLQSLPDGNLPQSLAYLIIVECHGNLKERCTRSGQDWDRIRLIPYIEIDDDLIQGVRSSN